MSTLHIRKDWFYEVQYLGEKPFFGNKIFDRCVVDDWVTIDPYYKDTLWNNVKESIWFKHKEENTQPQHIDNII